MRHTPQPLLAVGERRSKGWYIDPLSSGLFVSRCKVTNKFAINGDECRFISFLDSLPLVRRYTTAFRELLLLSCCSVRKQLIFSVFYSCNKGGVIARNINVMGAISINLPISS
jgi:hypothetical protein